MRHLVRLSGLMETCGESASCLSRSWSWRCLTFNARFSTSPETVADSPPISNPNYSRDAFSGMTKMSSLFLPNLEKFPSCGNPEDHSKNYRLLVEAGFIFPSQAGMFHFMPMGLKVLKKLSRVIAEEMERIGGQEVLLSTLTNSNLWRKSGRWDGAGKELFRLKDRQDKEHCLAPTFEENVTSMVSEMRGCFPLSQFPLRLFQISTKYRDEMTVRRGLLRGREFVMKDLYTFDRSPAEAFATYELVREAYERLFRRLGLPVLCVDGAVGKIGGSVSHEYQVFSEAGEDEIVYCYGCGRGKNVELLESSEHWSCDCDKPEIRRGSSIELGHAFLLGQKYSAPFRASFVDDRQEIVLMEMGCFGIGVSRLMAAIVEVISPPGVNSATATLWPRSVAPFQVALVLPKRGSKEETPDADLAIRRFLRGLVDSGSPLAPSLNEVIPDCISPPPLSPDDVLIDDRIDRTIGKRLRELRRVGVPLLVLAGQSLRREGRLEVLDAATNQTRFLTPDDAVKFVRDVVAKG